jgi:hypothetical protein
VLNFLYDQDGSVFLIDWYDANQCHHNRYDGHDRSNGRIYKIVYDNQPATRVDLQKLSDTELVALQGDQNEFKARHARRILQERAAAGRLTPRFRDDLYAAMLKESDTVKKLRLLWTIHVTGGMGNTVDLALERSDEYVRAWTIQLMCEGGRVSPSQREWLAKLAKTDSSPLVRLYLASALQRLPLEQRLPVLSALVGRGEDAGDHNLPLMYWYALEPVVGNVPGAGIDLLTQSRIPLLRQYITRRLTTESLAGTR